MTPKQLLRHIKKLKMMQPMTNEFIVELADIGLWNYQREARKKYGGVDQQKHWVGWLFEYDGPGFYSRKNWEGITAETIYRRVACPPMLLWLCEASGVKKSEIQKAKKAALEAKKSFPSQCAVIRKYIPWELVEQSLK